MGRYIDQLCETLRIKFTNVESNLAALRAKVEAQPQASEKEICRHLAGVQHRIKLGRIKLLTAQAEVEDRVASGIAVTAEEIAAWRVAREIGTLQNRADQAERYADASLEIALSAVDEAERAALEAWLARNDANAVTAVSRGF